MFELNDDLTHAFVSNTVRDATWSVRQADLANRANVGKAQRP